MISIFGALDMGGTNLRLALIDQNAEIVWQVRKSIGDAAFDKGSLLELLEQLLRSMPSDYAIQNFSFALPCIVNPIEQRLLAASNITADLQVSEIREVFSDCWPEIPLHFLNDVQAATLGEMQYGYLKNIQTGLYVNLGTGLACGLVVGGQLHSGANHAAGEIAYCMVNGHEVETGKSEMMLENQVSGRALERAICQQTNCESFSLSEFCSKENWLDTAEGHIIYQHLSLLLPPLFNFAVLLNPEVIVIGGGLSSLRVMLEPLISNTLAKLIFVPHLYFTKFPQNIGLLGSAFYGRQQKEATSSLGKQMKTR